MEVKVMRKILFLIVISLSISLFFNVKILSLEKDTNSIYHHIYPTFNFPTFVKILPNESGIDYNFNYLYHGIAIGDINGDNLDDIVISDMDTPISIYINNGNSSFKDISEHITQNGYCGHGVALVDIDNDGDLDLFFGNCRDNEPNQFFVNDGSGNFTDYTEKFPSKPSKTRGIAVLDVNRDGLYDIYIVNFIYPNELLINTGNLTFQNRTKEWKCEDNPPNKDGSQGVTSIDFNKDGKEDIYISRYSYTKPDQRNVLFLNNGTYFKNIANDLGVDKEDNNGATFSDLDNDGWYDLIISSHYHSNPLIIFKNIAGKFQELTSSLNINTESNTHFSIITGDLNNDGYEDIIIPGHFSKTKILFNTGNFNFIEKKVGIEDYIQDSRAVATFDYDNDGDLDIIIAGKKSGVFLYKNNLNPLKNSGSNFIQLLIKTPHGNLGGIGSKVFLFNNNSLNKNSLIYYREVKGPEAYLSQSSLTQHYGLSNITNVSIKIVYPDGFEDYLIDLDVNKKYLINFMQNIKIELKKEYEESLLFQKEITYLLLNSLEENSTIKLFINKNGSWQVLDEITYISSENDDQNQGLKINLSNYNEIENESVSTIGVQIIYNKDDFITYINPLKIIELE